LQLTTVQAYINFDVIHIVTDADATWHITNVLEAAVLNATQVAAFRSDLQNSSAATLASFHLMSLT
jgi:hypothetical protein